jgi:hypothetical protein|eukprot:COSAG01_NODE_13349_length_1597_cov_2.419893_2_plen_142_part_00
MPRRRAAAAADACNAEHFLASLSEMYSAVAQHGNIERELARQGGFLKIRNFLPEAVAEHALATLESFADDEWVADTGDCHRFASISCDGCEGYERLCQIARPLWLMLPGRVPTFSAGRYGRGHHIARHTGVPVVFAQSRAA